MKRIVLIAVVLTGLLIPAADGYAGHRHRRGYSAPYGGAGRVYAGRSSTFYSWSSYNYGRPSIYRTYPYAGYSAYGRAYPYASYSAYGRSYYPYAQRGVSFYSGAVPYVQRGVYVYPGAVYGPSVGWYW